AKALRAVTKNPKSFTRRNAFNRVIIGRLAEQIDRNDCGWPKASPAGTGDRYFEAFRIHVECVWPHVDEQRGRTHPGDWFRSRTKGKSRTENSVASSDFHRHEHEPQRISAVG